MADPADFTAVMNMWPDHAPKAWAQVQAQLTAEMAGLEETNTAKLAFSSELTALAQQFGTTIVEAAPAAALHTIANVTKAGCLEAVSGLVASVSGGVHSPADDAKLTTQVVGVLVSVGVAAGIATAGVGSAVIGVVSTLVGVLTQVGLFGQPAPGQQIPGAPSGWTSNPPASHIIGAPGAPFGGVPRWGNPVASAMIPSLGGAQANPDWMPFPELTPDLGDPNSTPPAGMSFQNRLIRAWYSNLGSSDHPMKSWNNFSLTSRTGVPDSTWGSWYGDFQGQRPIDIAFPAFARLMKEVQSGVGAFDPIFFSALQKVGPISVTSPLQTLAQFNQAYFAAWKKNCARSINGQKMSTDAEVLAYVLKIWNRVHDSGQWDLSLPDTGAPGLYIQTLLAELRQKGLTDDFSSDLHHVVIHGGGPAIVQPPPPIKLSLGGGAAPPPAIPITLVHGSPLAVLSVTPPPLWKRALPWLPLAAGMASWPVVGSVIAPTLGGAVTAALIEAQRKGWLKL